MDLRTVLRLRLRYQDPSRILKRKDCLRVHCGYDDKILDVKVVPEWAAEGLKEEEKEEVPLGRSLPENS